MGKSIFCLIRQNFVFDEFFSGTNEALEGLEVEEGQLARLVLRFVVVDVGRGGSFGLVDQGQLAKELAHAQYPDLDRFVLIFLYDANAALLDKIHAVRVVVLLKNAVAHLEHAGAQRVRQLTDLILCQREHEQRH